MGLESMQNMLIAIGILVVGGIGTVSWWFIKTLFEEAKSCRADWNKALTNCQDGKVPRKEYEHFLSSVTDDVGKIEKNIEAIHGRVNAIPSDLKVILDNERRAGG